MNSLKPAVGVSVILCALLSLADATAQRMISAKAGSIQYCYGGALLDDKPFRVPRDGYVQMENGQVLSTKLSRVEVGLGPSAILRLGENSSLAMEQTSLSDLRLELRRGVALVEVLDKIAINFIAFRISAHAVKIRKPGLYRLDSDRNDVQVYGGELSTSHNNKEIVVKKGRRILLDDRFALSEFDMRRVDALYIWSGFRSFTLFIANPYNRRMPNWKMTAKGELENSNFRLKFQTNSDWVQNWWKQEQYKSAYYQRIDEMESARRLEQLLREEAMRQYLQLEQTRRENSTAQ
jgi:hypothetical protein